MTLTTSTGALAAPPERSIFGVLDDGRTVESVRLTSDAGISVRLITLGAAIQSLHTPDAAGESADIVLGYDTPQEYLDKGQYFGSSVGRYANRIAQGRFELDGQTYQLDVNDGDNHLHGGADGFDQRLWTIEEVYDGERSGVVLSLVSPDGDGGYPGELQARVTYELTDSGELSIVYEAETSAPTIVNLTNHAYFNLAGVNSGESILDQTLVLNADRFTPVDSGLIPTGELRPVVGTPFDFTQPRRIGESVRDYTNEQLRLGRGYDHNWVLRDAPGALELAAVLEDPASGRRLEMHTTAPGIQFYSGNFLDGTLTGKDSVAHRQGDALCLEPQTFPNAPNEARFPSPRLNPGETYRNEIVLRFSVTDAATD
ncbi:aldose epimerase family protein [Oceanicaulis sp.]|uniref:aldose epimerase family protein n=1 Tax=Oceanicaulis sp. TaxID=1924941 RepID=UPI003F713F5A